jgi:mitochondrial chaperone BCS1
MNGTLAALLFMAAGAGMSMLREVPRRAASLLADLFSISIAVDENDPVHWFATWLAKQPYGGRCRRLKLWVKWRNFGDFGQESTVSMVELEPGLGPHLFRYRGRWFLLTREEHQQREHYADRTRLHLRTLGRTRQPLQALVQEVVEHGIRAMREQDLVRVNDDGGSWRMLEAGESRRLESVVLPRDERARVLADMQRFMARREWYASRGIPYRRGYLFFGPPGSGKTSLARSLAHELGLTLFVLDLSSARTTDQQLFALLAQVPPRSMVLVEDVDRTRPMATQAAAKAEKPADGSGATISGLLNAVDGPTSGEGRVLVFTTNNPDTLDPALVRPGRVDYRLEFRAADRRQAREIFLRFFPGEMAAAEAFAAALDGHALTMADLQGILLAAETGDDAVAGISAQAPSPFARLGRAPASGE